MVVEITLFPIRESPFFVLVGSWHSGTDQNWGCEFPNRAGSSSKESIEECPVHSWRFLDFFRTCTTTVVNCFLSIALKPKPSGPATQHYLHPSCTIAWTIGCNAYTLSFAQAHSMPEYISTQASKQASTHAQVFHKLVCMATCCHHSIHLNANQ